MLATVLLLVIAALAAGVWLLITQPWAAPTASPTPNATQSADPDATIAPTPDATDATATTPPAEAPTTPKPTPDASKTPKIVACEAADVKVVAQTDADTYSGGVLPKLSISLTNVSDVDCTLDVGSSTQKFVVTSGSDTWWRSTDCQTEPSSLIVTLKAGEEVTSATPVVWDRTRSSVDTCKAKNRPRAPGGGASYHVAVSIGGFESIVPKQFLLN